MSDATPTRPAISPMFSRLTTYAPAHDAPPAVGTAKDPLPVRHDDDGEQDRHHHRDRYELAQTEGQARRTEGRDEQNLFGRVRRRRQRIGREDRERDRLREPLLLDLRRRQRS